MNLRKLLVEAVKKDFYNGMLFSGGLDTSILASLNPNITGITVSLGSDADDIPYSVSLAKILGIKHFHRKADVDEAIESIPDVIRILKSFDPAIPNDLAVYFGIKYAKGLGLDRVATGDGSDEIFGGYSFMEDIDDLEGYIKRISGRMSFSSNDIGSFFGMKIIQPYMDKTVVEYALRIPVDLKIRKENGRVFGKWILRKAFEDVLPKNIIWQDKRPLEYGSGMNRLRRIISEKVSDEEFREHTEPVKFMNKEHLYYYRIYKKVVGEIPKPEGDEKGCPGCGAGMRNDSFHCKICGHV